MNRNRKPIVLAIMAASVAINLLLPPYFAYKADEPALVHAAMGAYWIWSPPSSRQAYEALRERFPDRVAALGPALPQAEMNRLFQAKVNKVRFGVHLFAGLAVAAALGLLLLRRRGQSDPPRKADGN